MFFRINPFVVKNKIADKNYRIPSVDIDPEHADAIIVLRLAKAGYWNGDPERIRDAPVESVLEAIWFEGFSSQYENAMFELNKDNKE